MLDACPEHTAALGGTSRTAASAASRETHTTFIDFDIVRVDLIEI
jgi:hypothetical protein